MELLCRGNEHSICACTSIFLPSFGISTSKGDSFLLLSICCGMRGRRSAARKARVIDVRARNRHQRNYFRVESGRGSGKSVRLKAASGARANRRCTGCPRTPAKRTSFHATVGNAEETITPAFGGRRAVETCPLRFNRSSRANWI